MLISPIGLAGVIIFSTFAAVGAHISVRSQELIRFWREDAPLAPATQRREHIKRNEATRNTAIIYSLVCALIVLAIFYFGI